MKRNLTRNVAVEAVLYLQKLAVAANWMAIAVAIMLLSGCGKPTELVGMLSEEEANTVLGVLLGAGIEARKEAKKTGLVVLVESGDVAKAIDLLNKNGLPRQRRATLGDVFQKENLVSSPLEERARYLYALSQELEKTLLNIDGVVTARVHVVLPSPSELGESDSAGSASVFLKYRPGFGVENAVSQVKMMVANSLPSLTPDKVSVALLAAVTTRKNDSDRLERVWAIPVDPASAGHLRYMLIGLAVWAVSATVGIVFMNYKKWKSDVPRQDVES